MLKRKVFVISILTICALSFSTTAAEGALFEAKSGTYPAKINETGSWFVLVSQGVGSEFRVLCEKGDADKGELKEASPTLEYVPTYEKCIIELKKEKKNESVNASVKGCTYKLLEPLASPPLELEGESAYEGPFEISGGSSCEITFTGKESKCKVTANGQGPLESALYKDTPANELELQLVGSKGALYTASECAGVVSGTHEAYELAELVKFSEIKMTGPICVFPYCGPTITPGVMIGVAQTVGEAACTAGPIMTEGAKTFLLTAGHCFGAYGKAETGIKQKVQSEYPKVKGKKKVGETATFAYNKEYDIGEVEVEKGPMGEWLPAGTGALPLIAIWSTPKPVTPLVIGPAGNTVGEESCHSGAATERLPCGIIIGSGTVEIPQGSGKLVEKVFETSAGGKPGDSGGPAFTYGIDEVMIQGVFIAGGSNELKRTGDLTKDVGAASGLPEGKATCKIISEMKSKWPDGVPIKGAGIPVETTTVTACRVVEPGNTATITISKEALETGARALTIGYPSVGVYEPISRIKEKFKGQTLLMKEPD